jgi:hypothetical protein
MLVTTPMYRHIQILQPTCDSPEDAVGGSRHICGGGCAQGWQGLPVPHLYPGQWRGTLSLLPRQAVPSQPFLVQKGVTSCGGACACDGTHACMTEISPLNSSAMHCRTLVYGIISLRHGSYGFRMLTRARKGKSRAVENGHLCGLASRPSG